MGEAVNGAPPSTVFVSYSRGDADWVRRFRVMLKPDVDNQGLDLWVDDRIAPGDRWRPELEAAIARTRLALLLVSPDFLASAFIMDIELPALVAAGARLFPVLVRPCRYQQVPLLQEVQWAHDPGRDGPLALARGARKDARIVQVCQRLVELVEENPAPTPSEPTPGAPDRTDEGNVVVPAALFRGGRAARAEGVPPLPRFHARRPELAQLRAALLDPGTGAVGMTGGVPGVGLAGQGGIGKTVLAAELALDPDTAVFFPDGIHWVTVGEQTDPVTAQLDLLVRLGAPTTQVRTAQDGAQVLQAALADRQCLLIVDDVWTAQAAEAFRVTGPRGRILYTSRNPDALAAADASVYPVDVLTAPTARGLLADLTGVRVADLPAAADRVLAATGRVALAVALAGAAVRGGTGWTDIAAAWACQMVCVRPAIGC